MSWFETTTELEFKMKDRKTGREMTKQGRAKLLINKDAIKKLVEDPNDKSRCILELLDKEMILLTSTFEETLSSLRRL